MSSRPLRLLAGLATGLLAGILIKGAPQALLGGVLQPLGALWLDALTMTVVPLVFSLLVTGVASASRTAEAGGTATRTLVLFAIMLTVGCLTAAALAETMLHYWPVLPGGLPSAPTAAGPLTAPTSAWYQSIIPTNPVRAAADTAIVPLVVFALFLGFALAKIGHDAAEPLLRLLRALIEAMLVIVGWVLAVGPIGIAALSFGAGAKFGAGVLGVLGHYVVVVAACCVATTLLGYGWAVIFGRLPLVRFARAVFPSQAVALGTQSSLATLPVMVEATGALDVAPGTGAMVIPLAVSLFRAASASANVAVTVYLAHMYGVPLGIGSLVLAALVAVPVSLGAVGLPAQVSFFATIAPVCAAVGVPVTALPLLLAIEFLPDLFRTVGNVTNDVAVTCVVDRFAARSAAVER